MANYEVTVKMSAADVASLKSQKFKLYGLKAVEAAGSGYPTIWFKLGQNKLMENTKTTWEDKYKGYNSVTVLDNNVKIVAGNSISVKIGKLITIEKESGNLIRSNNGVDGTIAFINDTTQNFTIGLRQRVEEKFKILCGFNILGSGAAKVITPVPKIALIFSTANIKSGVTVSNAISNGALIDFSESVSRTVEFNMKLGWSANNATWLTTFNAFTDLRTLLIQSPSEAEKKLEKNWQIFNKKS